MKNRMIFSTSSLMNFPLCLFVFFMSCHVLHCYAVYQITPLQPLFQNQTLVSSSQIFELGFFTPNGSENQYIGMWYKNMTPSKIIWVANRDKPLSYKDSFATLTIGSDGSLKLLNGQQNVVWSIDASVQTNNTAAVLLDTGNFVLQDVHSGNYFWESFDVPTDTLLPGMKMGINSRTGKKHYLISWRSDNDPSSGDFIAGLSSETPAQSFIWKGSVPYWRSGQWDKSTFIGIPYMDNRYLTGFTLEQDVEQGTAYFYIQSYQNPLFCYSSISSRGSLGFASWDERVNKWETDWEAPRNRCETYGTCGPFGVCNALDLPICSCLKGFTPKINADWNEGNWTAGCIRERELNCQKNTGIVRKKDGFWQISHVKLPDHTDYISDIGDAGDCEDWCLNNCSCIAYSYVRTIGCMVWNGGLLDTQQFTASGEDLFLRLANVQAGQLKQTREIVAYIGAALGIITIGVAGLLLWNCRASQRRAPYKTRDLSQGNAWEEKLKREDGSKMQIFNFDDIVAATNNFSMANKLGQGGFGPVYKGKLKDGKEVAVKRLFSSSGQGIEEFRNEIVLLSKLQHRNLVQLIGCCMEQEEKILVYEHLPNKSLDTFIFDLKRKAELDWNKRFCIIVEVARGLLYLHRDSCLRVIHRDLKASNILLDEKFKPKISDFGLARMFQGTKDLVNTRRVVGTLGYMAVEYAMAGIFSEKSDVYSFGVLLIEIVSSKKNTTLCYNGEDLNLLSYAWKLWQEGRGLDLMDETISDSSSPSEVMKCIQIGLLCVQDRAVDRPNMLTVVLMLSGESKLPQPKEPTFIFKNSFTPEIPSPHQSSWSKNTVTNSLLQGR